MIKILLIIFIFQSCTSFNKKEEHRRVQKMQKVADDFYIMGEVLRREHRYSDSLDNYSKALNIYKNKFDYENEAKVLLKMGFVLSKMKKRNHVDTILARLHNIKSKFKDGDFKIKALEIRKHVELGEKKIVNKEILGIIDSSSGIRQQYYKSLYISYNDFQDDKRMADLVRWSNDNSSITSKLNEISSPESLIFIFKTIAKIAKRKKNNNLFLSSIEACEKIVNYFELIEFSKSIKLLKNSY